MRFLPSKLMLSALLTGSLTLAGCTYSEIEEGARKAISSEAPGPLANSAAARMQTDVTWLADDAREGREAGTEGYLEAADYVAERFQSLGIAPGNGDSYRQNVEFRLSKRDDDAASLSFTNADGSVSTLTNLQDFISGRSSDGENYAVDAPLVFAGYGVVAPGHDDYAGLDVDGKIVVYFNGAPAGLNSETRAHFRSGRVKAELAAARGALGMIALSPLSGNAAAAWQRATSRPDGERWSWVGPDGTANDGTYGMAPTMFLGPDGASALFENEQIDFATLSGQVDDPQANGPLTGFALTKSASFTGGSSIETVESPNVVGFLEGSDPVLRDEIIVLSAHLDHVGVYQPRSGGEDFIHNGALDNAMGISTMLEVANRFFRDGAPKRSVIFIAVTAEEKGLLGSDFFATHPTVDKERIVANVNLDMPLVLYPFSDVIAFGAERSSLGATVRAAAANTDVEIIDDPWPNLNLFVRSDHYSFVKQGVPSVFLFLGTGNGGQENFEKFMATNYHQPSDEIDLNIQWDEAARFANLNYLIARELADVDETPAWKEGDFFGELFGQN